METNIVTTSNPEPAVGQVWSWSAGGPFNRVELILLTRIEQLYYTCHENIFRGILLYSDISQTMVGLEIMGGDVDKLYSHYWKCLT